MRGIKVTQGEGKEMVKGEEMKGQGGENEKIYVYDIIQVTCTKTLGFHD